MQNNCENIRNEIVQDISERSVQSPLLGHNYFRFIENGGVACNQCGITFPQSQVAKHSTNCNYSALTKQCQAVEVRLSTLPKDKYKHGTRMHEVL